VCLMGCHHFGNKSSSFKAFVKRPLPVLVNNSLNWVLTKLGNVQTKKTWMTHGAQEPCLGVKVEDM